MVRDLAAAGVSGRGGPVGTVLRALFASLAIAAATAPAQAFEPMQGCFVAERDCPAPRAIQRRSPNPGHARIEPGRAYELLGANKLPATHYQVRVPRAEPATRWVQAACGRVERTCSLATDTAPAPARPAADADAKGGSHAENLLAVSWQPAFCETHRDTPECASQTPGRFDATHFALHGLWPQPREVAYCGVDPDLAALDGRNRWNRLPKVELSPATRDALARAMPGTQSGLDRHEWIKHGTCYAETADEYYRESLQLLAELNASPVRDLFADRIGRSLSFKEIRTAFDQAFGKGAGDKVAMDCRHTRGRQLALELKINLSGEITPTSRLADLLAQAPDAHGGEEICQVDEAGFADD